MEKAREGSPVPLRKGDRRARRRFDVRMGDGSWPCQKPPWGRLTAVNAVDGRHRVAGAARHHRPTACGQAEHRTGGAGRAIVTASGLVFIASTDDNRFRALDAKTGKELWVTRLERRGNANPITYQGRNGKQYVAIVATDTLVVYTLAAHPHPSF